MCCCCHPAMAFRPAARSPGLHFMDRGAIPPVRDFLARKVRDGASSAQLADAILSAWDQIILAMAPVIGQRGVAAMYDRSVHLSVPAHPWLGAAHPGGNAAMDLGALRSALERQGSAEAASGGGALLLAFHEVVVSLIGPTLSGQLLGAMWRNVFSSAGSAA